MRTLIATAAWLAFSAATASAAAGDSAPAATAKAAPAKVAGAAPRSHSVLPFIEDDYTKALAQARARKLPLFIEAWAPW